jgi:hypothetical protein
MNVAIGKPNPRHEPDRVPLPPVVKATIWLIVVIIATHLLVWNCLPLSHSPAAGAGVIPITPAADDWGVAGREQLRALRAREEANLNGYQWLDDRHTKARIPIDRAMDLLLQGSQGAVR